MNYDNLTGVVPKSVTDALGGIITTYSINTPLRLAHFLAQCSHESGGFSITHENLNYSKAALLRVFHKYFPTDDMASQYANHPNKIGARVYANRMGNGTEASGEGYLYRGRGYIQLTGKFNYGVFGASIGVDLVANPELVATEYPLRSGAWFWTIHNLNALADTGASDEVVGSITKVINGGYNGLPDRIAQFNKFYGLLNVG